LTRVEQSQVGALKTWWCWRRVVDGRWMVGWRRRGPRQGGGERNGRAQLGARGFEDGGKKGDMFD